MNMILEISWLVQTPEIAHFMHLYVKKVFNVLMNFCSLHSVSRTQPTATSTPLSFRRQTMFQMM